MEERTSIIFCEICMSYMPIEKYQLHVRGCKEEQFELKFGRDALNQMKGLPTLIEK